MAARSRSADGNETWLTRFFAAAMARRSKEAIRRASASTKPSSSASGSARLTYRIVPRCRRRSRSRRGRFQAPDRARPDVGGVPYRHHPDAIPPRLRVDPVSCSRATQNVVVTAEMPTNYFVGYAKKTLVRTFGALDSRFLANSPDPLIAASWRIASSACLTAFEALRINILSSMKQRAEESNFGLGG